MDSSVENPRVITYKALLGAYLFVPITFMVVLLDRYAFHSVLRQMLPRSPEPLRLYLVFLVFPHIVASALSFLDREYLTFYRVKLVQGLGVAVILGALLPWWGPPALVFAVYIFYTTYHNMAQQVGVAMFMTGKPTFWFKLWKWCLILTTMVMFYLSMANMHRHWPQINFGSWGILTLPRGLYVLMMAGLFALPVLTLAASVRSKSRWGVSYLWANCLLVLFTAFYFRSGYYCFAIALTRIVHDFTGFLFYVVHDANRNNGTVRNIVYSLFRSWSVPIYLLSPLLAIVLANGLVQFKSYALIAKFLIALGYFHYYTEGFMWKRDALHRQFVPVVNGPVTATRLNPLPLNVSLQP